MKMSWKNESNTVHNEIGRTQAFSETESEVSQTPSLPRRPFPFRPSSTVQSADVTSGLLRLARWSLFDNAQQGRDMFPLALMLRAGTLKLRQRGTKTPEITARCF